MPSSTEWMEIIQQTERKLGNVKKITARKTTQQNDLNYARITMIHTKRAKLFV